MNAEEIEKQITELRKIIIKERKDGELKIKQISDMQTELQKKALEVQKCLNKIEAFQEALNS